MNAELCSEAVAKGVYLLKRGWADFSKWSRAMVYEFGEPIRPHLDRIWLNAQDEWQRQQTAAPTLPQVGQPEPGSEGKRSRRRRGLPNSVLVPVYAVIAGLVLVSASIWMAASKIARRAATSAKNTSAGALTDEKVGLKGGTQQESFTFEDALAAERDSQARAEKGEPEAQIKLAEQYDKEKKYSEAVKWYRKAAEQGNAVAQNNLGVAYEKGEGVAQSYVEAARWYRKAAEQEHAAAQSVLGGFYNSGKGVRQDFAEAVKWYRKAAEQGNADAQFGLAKCYEKGEGVAQNYVEAASWYRKAAEQGDANSQGRLGERYYNGQRVPKDAAEASKWWLKAANQGDVYSQHNLGVAYANGEGLPLDFAESGSWFRKAAKQGLAAAQRELGLYYYEGRGVSKDYAEAVKWYREAAEQSETMAQNDIGVCYMHGRGVPKDHTKAVDWFRRSAAQGNPYAQFSLGVCYYNGQGVAKNDIQAYKWYRLAAAQQSEDASKWRDWVAQQMARAEVVEGQRLAAAFVARTEGDGTGSNKFSPRPEVGEGKMLGGTGFFVTDDGYLVTCEHVVRAACRRS